jgi:hypothetical protein
MSYVLGIPQSGRSFYLQVAHPATYWISGAPVQDKLKYVMIVIFGNNMIAVHHDAASHEMAKTSSVVPPQRKPETVWQLTIVLARF